MALTCNNENESILCAESDYLPMVPPILEDKNRDKVQDGRRQGKVNFERSRTRHTDDSGQCRRYNYPKLGTFAVENKKYSTVGKADASVSVMICPEALHVNTSICPGVSMNTYLPHRVSRERNQPSFTTDRVFRGWHTRF